MSVFFKKMVLALGFSLISVNVFAHSNVVVKDNLDAYSGRNYQEATTANLKFQLPHGCRNTSRTKFYATKHAAAVFPNSNLLTGITITEDKSGNEYAGNAMMSIKPFVNPVWDKVKISRGSVPNYYSHGVNSTDVRGIKWLGGKIPYDMVTNLNIKASLPKLTACVTLLKVYVPLVQYCENGQVLAWMKQATPTFPIDVISQGYAPSFTIIRNEIKNPLPASCSGIGESVEVYPSEADIEQFLPLKKYKKNRHD